MSFPPCTNCQYEFVYQDQTHIVCPECAYEWNPVEEAENQFTVHDVNGN